MELYQMEIELDNLMKSPEYKKYKIVTILLIISILFLLIAVISYEIANVLAGNEYGTEVFPIYTIILYVIGIGFVIIFLIASMFVPREFRKKLKKLRMEIKLYKKIEKKGNI